MLLPVLIAQAAFAADVVYQEVIQGGISVDATAVDAHGVSPDVRVPAENLKVQVPSEAIVTEAFLILHAKIDGFGSISGGGVTLNGFIISDFAIMLCNSCLVVLPLRNLDIVFKSPSPFLL